MIQVAPIRHEGRTNPSRRSHQIRHEGRTKSVTKVAPIRHKGRTNPSRRSHQFVTKVASNVFFKHTKEGRAIFRLQFSAAHGFGAFQTCGRRKGDISTAIFSHAWFWRVSNIQAKEGRYLDCKFRPRMVLARFKHAGEGRVKIRPHFSKNVFEWNFIKKLPPPSKTFFLPIQKMKKPNLSELS